MDEDLKEEIQALDKLKLHDNNNAEADPIATAEALTLINALSIDINKSSAIKRLADKINSLVAEGNIRIDQNGIVTLEEETEKEINSATEEDLNDFKDFMAHLLEASPRKRPEIAEIPHNMLERTIQQLNAMKNGKDGNAGLIATDMTPEQLTDLIDQIKQRAENGEALIVGFMQMQAPTSNEAYSHSAG